MYGATLGRVSSFLVDHDAIEHVLNVSPWPDSVTKPYIIEGYSVLDAYLMSLCAEFLRDRGYYDYNLLTLQEYKGAWTASAPKATAGASIQDGKSWKQKAFLVQRFYNAAYSVRCL